MNDEHIDDMLNIRDLGLAAALVSLDYQPVGTRNDYESGRVYFIFLKSEEIQEAVDKYWANTLTVKARYYFDAIKMIKSRIYEGR